MGGVTYTGEVKVGGPAQQRELPKLNISKIAVGPMDNNAYLLRCESTGEGVLIDAANEPDRLLELIGDDLPLTRVITTHQHPDHWQGLAAVVGGVLVLTDQFYSGWRATLDGQPADLYRADTVFRAVCVPAGDHVVRFEYRPLSLYIGMIVSAISWLAIMFLAINELWKMRQAANG